MAILWVAMSFNINKPLNNSPENKLVISFKNYIGIDILKLDSVSYKNELNQSFTVTNFKYYISNIHLKKADGKEFISTNYFLINEDDKKSKQLLLNKIPDGEYTSISFTIGVDSLHNCSGAQSGALDPANGMFWAWNTGYIFLKLEGKAPLSNSPGHIFEYHIGGYKQPVNCIRSVSLGFKNEKVIISNSGTSTIEMKTDASELLKSPTIIDFSKLSSVTDFHNATTIADNYKDMFSILKVSNEK
jgi:hypothetical protein